VVQEISQRVKIEMEAKKTKRGKKGKGFFAVAPYLTVVGSLPGPKRKHETNENKRNRRKAYDFSFVSSFFVCFVFSLQPLIPQTTVD
jgi:hypothetical protein